MEYTIESLIDKYSNKDYIIIVMDLTREVNQLDKNHKFPHKEYKLYAGDFLYFLNTGGIPNGIGKEGIKKFLPIIEYLIKKGQMNESVLKKLQ